MWSYNHEKWDELKAWIHQGNLTSNFQFIGTGRDAVLVSSNENRELVGYAINQDSDRYWKEDGELVAIALFECPRDALLFKLTW